ncbi:MAG: hypothetical protein AB7T06_00685 [Kofleriaceae bacterium]
MKLALLVTLCAPALAFADDVTPKPGIVVDAPVHETPVKQPTDGNIDHSGEEANLEPQHSRRGFFFHLGGGASITVGGGTGTGGTLSLVFGAVMTRELVMVLATTASGQGHEVMDKLHINDYTSIGIGLQWWPGNGAVHVRGTAGFGGYRCKQCVDPAEETNPVPIDYQRRGIGLNGAVGVDIVRRGGFALGLELAFINTVHRLATSDGVIVGIASQLYASFD